MPNWVSPIRLMLMAAFVSLSKVVWQHSHFQLRCLSARSVLTVPHTWQALLEGAHLSIFTTVEPALPATHSSIDTNSAKARSETFRPHRRFIPSRLRSSMQMTAYSPTSWFVSKPRQILLHPGEQILHPDVAEALFAPLICFDSAFQHMVVHIPAATQRFVDSFCLLFGWIQTEFESFIRSQSAPPFLGHPNDLSNTPLFLVVDRFVQTFDFLNRDSGLAGNSL